MHASAACSASTLAFEADRLDRHAALAWINQGWLTYLTLPAELAVFGADSKAKFTTLQEAVEQSITLDDSAKTVGTCLRLLKTGDLAVARRLRQQLQSWEATGHQVQLHLLDSTFSALPKDQKTWLAKLAFNGIQICLHSSIPNLAPLALNITLQGGCCNIANLGQR